LLHLGTYNNVAAALNIEKLQACSAQAGLYAAAPSAVKFFLPMQMLSSAHEADARRPELRIHSDA
jgi:hypothetical protein